MPTDSAPMRLAFQAREEDPRSRVTRAGAGPSGKPSAKWTHSRSVKFWRAFGRPILGTAAVLVLFSDARVLLRVLVPIRGLPEIIAAVAVAAIALGSVALRRREDKGVSWEAMLGAFAAVSLARFLFAGYNWLTVIQWLPAYVGAVGAAAIGSNRSFLKTILTAFAIAMGLHALSIYVPLEFLQEGLDAHTAYGLSTGGARHTGLTYAPGFLSLLSSMGIAAGSVLYSSERRIIWAVLLVSSLACGLATLNRSFLGGAAVAAVVSAFMTWRIGVRRWSPAAAFAVLLAALWVGTSETDYGERITERLDEAVLRQDLETRTTGAAGTLLALEAAIRSPLWGSVAFNEIEGRVMVHDGERFVQVHNGFAWVLGTRGFIVGLLFYYWSALAVGRLWKATRGPGREERAQMAALLSMYAAGQAVSMFEAFHETYVMLLPVAIGLTLRSRAMGPRLRSVGGSRKALGWTPSTGSGRLEVPGGGGRGAGAGASL